MVREVARGGERRFGEVADVVSAGLGSDELLWRDATAQAESIRRGEVSAEDLLDAAIEKLERVDEALAVLVHRRYDSARRELQQVDRQAPFAGVPMVLKDLISHIAGEPFHEGIRGVARRGFVANEDTELVRRFRTAGLAILGITTTPELGAVPLCEPLLHPPVRNPWDQQRSTMGSSGGSAAAVATGAVAVGHGNDLGGSLRLPAAACGIVGLKPSRGRVSLAPDFGDLMNGFIAEFVMTRSVRDTAGVLEAVSGAAPGDPYSVGGRTDFLEALERPSSGLRIGLHPVADHLAYADAVRQTGETLESLGHRVEESHPPALGEPEVMLWCGEVVFTFAEFALDWWHRTLGEPLTADDVEPHTWWLAEQSRQRTPAAYLRTVESIQAWSRRVAGWWEQGYDVLVTPTLRALPPEIGTYRFNPENPFEYLIGTASHSGRTMDWNLTGAPAISIPVGMSDGLPVGVQLVAPLGMDRTVIDVAAQLERAMPWHDRRPPGW